MARWGVAGCKFYIGGVLDDKSTDFIASDFTSQTWTEVKEWITMGGLGDAAAIITSQIIGEQRDKSAKGTRAAPQQNHVFNNDPTDAGQIAVIAAEKTSSNYAFKIEFNDKPSAGASPKNSLRYFVGLVTEASEQGGQANTTRTLNVTIMPNSNIVRVAASAT